MRRPLLRKVPTVGERPQGPYPVRCQRCGADTLVPDHDDQALSCDACHFDRPAELARRPAWTAGMSPDQVINLRARFRRPSASAQLALTRRERGDRRPDRETRRQARGESRRLDREWPTWIDNGGAL